LLARGGACVVAADRDRAGEQVVEAINAGGAEAVFVEADLTRAGDCEEVVRAARDQFGGLDLLINNAGVVLRASIEETSEADWDLTMDVNVKAIFLLSKAAIPAMAAGGGGAIVNTASGWGLAAGPRAAAYCASKGAVVQLTKAMAIDHAAQGIRVNCVCPGDIDTPMLVAEADALGVPRPEFLAAAGDRPMARVGSPEEVARAILYLAGDTASYVTGTALVIDGGGLLG